MGRIIAAVGAGYVLIGLLVVTTDQVFAMAIPGFRDMTTPPDYYFVSSLITDTLYIILGGYLCCALARGRYRTATWSLLIFGQLIGIVTQAALWNTVPHWFGIGLMCVYPPAVWAGAWLRSRLPSPKTSSVSGLA